jgi:hypothetical protein
VDRQLADMRARQEEAEARRRRAQEEARQAIEDSRRRMEETRRQNLPEWGGSIPGSPYGSSGSEWTKECCNCGASLPDSTEVGDTCPSCGVLFLAEEDEFGRTVNRASPFSGGGLGAVGAIAGLVFVLVVVLLGIAGAVRAFQSGLQGDDD